MSGTWCPDNLKDMGKSCQNALRTVTNSIAPLLLMCLKDALKSEMYCQEHVAAAAASAVEIVDPQVLGERL